MKKESVKELFKKASVKVGSLVLAAAILAGSSAWYESSHQVPELVTYVDSEGSVSIEEEEVPLAAPKVTKSTKTTKSTKNIKLKKASAKSYTQTGKTTKKTTTKTSSTTKQTTTTKTETATSVSNKFTKGSKVQKQTTTVKTTVTKTVVTKAAAASTTAKNGTVSVTSIAPKVDKRVSNAFNKLGFTVKINSGVSYSGLMDARTRTITLKKSDATIYHELGHFVAFVAGNVDTTASFKAIYNSEKSKYTAYNKAYVLSNSSEYFAESFKNYVENPAALKKARPKTYAAIQSALNKITDSQVNKIATVYKAVWK